MRSRLEREGAAPADPRVGRVPADERAGGPTGRDRPGQPPACGVSRCAGSTPRPSATRCWRLPANWTCAPAGRTSRASGRRRASSRSRRSGRAAHRRSVYLQQRRTQVVTLLSCSTPRPSSTTCGKRTPSTVPLQSLALLNSEFARARAKALRRPPAREARPRTTTKRLTWRSAWPAAAPPLADERAACETLPGQQRRGLRQGEGRRRYAAWADLCQMILASNAFLYVE